MVRIGPWDKEDLAWLNGHKDEINNILRTRKGLYDFMKSEGSPKNFTPVGYQKAGMFVLALGYGFNVFKPKDFTFWIYNSSVFTEIQIYCNWGSSTVLYSYVAMGGAYFDEEEEEWLDKAQRGGIPSNEIIDFCKNLCEWLAEEGENNPMSKVGEIVKEWLDQGMAIKIDQRG